MPQDRFRKIAQAYVFLYHRSEFVVESGIQIDTQALQVNPRRINVPKCSRTNFSYVFSDVMLLRCDQFVDTEICQETQAQFEGYCH